MYVVGTFQKIKLAIKATHKRHWKPTESPNKLSIKDTPTNFNIILFAKDRCHFDYNRTLQSVDTLLTGFNCVNIKYKSRIVSNVFTLHSYFADNAIDGVYFVKC